MTEDAGISFGTKTFLKKGAKYILPVVWAACERGLDLRSGGSDTMLVSAENTSFAGAL